MSSTSNTIPTQKQPSKAVVQKQIDAELKQFHAQLEHLLATGNEIRHEQWQTKAWKQQQQQHQQTGKRPRPTSYTHPQSLRLYGDDTWPNKRNKPANYEAPWNAELGDQVDSIFFADYKLSQQLPAAAGGVSGQHVPPETVTTIAIEQVPRAMVLRCWDRAVQAAANTVPVELSTRPVSRETNANNYNNNVSSNLDMSRDTAKLKYQSLQLQQSFSETEASLECPTCHVRFDSHRPLEDHFFGNDKVTGFCCWQRIHNQQRQLLQQILQGEIDNQSRALLRGLLLYKTAVQNEGATKESETRDWTCVLEQLQHMLQAALSVATPTENENKIRGTVPDVVIALPDVNPLQETLQILPKPNETSNDTAKDNTTCLVLNPVILERVTRRLVQRYGMVPR